MTTTYYYVSYGKPPRPPLWRYVLLGLLMAVALALAAGIGYGIYELASGSGPASTATAPSDDIAPNLQDTLSRINNDTTSGYILVENSHAATQIVPEALLDLADTEDGRRLSSSLRLAPFANKSGHLHFAEYASESDATQEGWLNAIAALPSPDLPDFIYDTVDAAHRNLVELDDGHVKNNTITLITDGLDGGYAVFDIEAIGPCPPEVQAEPGDVCGQILQTVVADVDQLVPCPLELGAPPDFVCNPKSAAGVDDADIVYDSVNPEFLMPCPSEFSGPNAVCYDIVAAYQRVRPEDLEPCPPELGAAPGQACAELRSETTETELLAMIADSPVTNLRVHVIGLGDREDHEFLRLLAAAGNGEYIYCSARGCESP